MQCHAMLCMMLCHAVAVSFCMQSAVCGVTNARGRKPGLFIVLSKDSQLVHVIDGGWYIDDEVPQALAAADKLHTGSEVGSHLLEAKIAMSFSRIPNI